MSTYSRTPRPTHHQNRALAAQAFVKCHTYNSYCDDETCEDYDNDVKIDEIDKVEEFFKINIHILLKMKTIMQK